MKPCFQILALPQEFLEKTYLQSLSPDEKTKFSNMKDTKASRTYLFSRYLVKNALSKKLHLPIEQIQFVVSPEGKPGLPRQECYFNLSHSQDLCGYALSHKKIGFDIQIIQPLKTAQKIIKNYFHAEELQIYSNSHPHDQLDIFYRLWVLKEAYGKAHGHGLKNAQKIDFSPYILKPKNNFQIHDASFSYHKKQHPNQNNTFFYLALCELQD